jgi:hypothetical protein
MPKLAAIMDDAENEVLAYMPFPKEHRLKLHSTNQSSVSTARSSGAPRTSPASFPKRMQSPGSSGYPAQAER